MRFNNHSHSCTIKYYNNVDSQIKIIDVLLKYNVGLLYLIQAYSLFKVKIIGVFERYGKFLSFL